MKSLLFGLRRKSSIDILTINREHLFPKKKQRKSHKAYVHHRTSHTTRKTGRNSFHNNLFIYFAHTSSCWQYSRQDPASKYLGILKKKITSPRESRYIYVKYTARKYCLMIITHKRTRYERANFAQLFGKNQRT